MNLRLFKKNPLSAGLRTVGIGALSLFLSNSVLRADVILNNAPYSAPDISYLLGGTTDSTHQAYAYGITTGSSDLTFESMEASLYNPNSTTPVSVVGGIYTDVDGQPGSLYAAFVPYLASNNAYTIGTFETAAPTILQANTTYWFFLDGPTTSGQQVSWVDAVDHQTAPVVTSPVTFVDLMWTKNSGSTWRVSNGGYMGVTISAEAVPEPSAYVLLGLGLAVILFRLRRRAAIA